MDYPRKLVVPKMQLSATAQRTLDAAAEEFARATRFPLTFGGFESGGLANITSLWGNRTLSLQGLRVASGLGLGGRAMIESRPRLTADYSRSPHITHDYDGEVLGEGIVSLFAMPVLLDGDVRAVLYGGTRRGSTPSNAFLQAGASVANELAKEIRIEDEVNRRIVARTAQAAQAARAAQSANTATPDELPASVREELRGGHAELRRIVASCEDPALRDQLLALERRLAKIGTADARSGAGAAARLSPRELDVITHAALGATNLEIGRSLSLTESTVKSYLKSAMSKLEASTRHAAVASARRAGLIP